MTRDGEGKQGEEESGRTECVEEFVVVAVVQVLREVGEDRCVGKNLVDLW